MAEPVLSHRLIPARQRQLLAIVATNPRSLDRHLAAVEADLACRVAPAMAAASLPSRVTGPAGHLRVTSIIMPSASIPAARQNRSNDADTSSQALPTGTGGNAVAIVVILFMALLSFRGFDTPSLPAQGEQRRSSYFNIDRDIPPFDVKLLWSVDVPKLCLPYCLPVFFEGKFVGRNLVNFWRYKRCVSNEPIPIPCAFQRRAD